MDSLYVIAYDIVSNRRRNSVARILKDYGRRVNFSVFECELKGDKLQELKKKIAVVINKRRDIILVYPLCLNCRKKGEIIGRKSGLKVESVIRI